MKPQFYLPLTTYPEASTDKVAASAAAVAAEFGAALHVGAFEVDIPEVSNALSKLLLDTPQMIRDAEALSRKRGQRLIAAARESAEKVGVDLVAAELHVALAAFGETAAREARYFDMALVGWEVANQTARVVAEAVVFGAGRPTLMLPEQAPFTSAKHVAIAWDGSRVAARAVADAHPFLEKASSVSVITVVNEKALGDSQGAERLAASFSAAGRDAQAVFIDMRGSSIGAVLQETASSKGAGLLVMGGYGHSRVRDFVLGGATAGVLDDLEMPVLLSH